MKIERVWSMPCRDTFSIKPISDLLDRYCHGMVVDPFARNSKRGTITNDLDHETSAEFHEDALVFMKRIDDGCADVVLFDPPYSPRQISESYKKCGLSVNKQTTDSSFWSSLKGEISRVTRIGGISITFGWCSNGIGKRNGFEIVEIMLVAHGSWHNDTIVTVERKVN